MTLTDEQKKAWRRAKRFYHPGGDPGENILADALLDALAELAESEFWLAHWFAQTCCSDPRHDYSKSDWRDAVRKELSDGY